MSNEKYLHNQLKKVKKKWPVNLKPYLLPTGQLQVVESCDQETLQAKGISSLEDLMNNQHKLTPPQPSNNNDKAVKKLMALIEEMSSFESPEKSIPILQEYFPDILERL